MEKVFDKIDYALIAIGTTYSVANMKEILGLIVLAIQLIWLIVKLVVKVVHYIKQGKNLDELDDEVEDLTEIFKEGDKKDVRSTRDKKPK